MKIILPATWAQADISAKELRPMLPGGDDEDAYPDEMIADVASAATEFVERRVGAWLAPRDGIEVLHPTWGRPGQPRSRLELAARPLTGQRIGPSNIANVAVSYLAAETGDSTALAAEGWRMVWTADEPAIWIAANAPPLFQIEPHPVSLKYDWRPPRPPDSIREAVALAFRALATARAAGEPLNMEAVEGLSALLAGWRGPRAAFV